MYMSLLYLSRCVASSGASSVLQDMWSVYRVSDEGYLPHPSSHTDSQHTHTTSTLLTHAASPLLTHASLPFLTHAVLPHLMLRMHRITSVDSLHKFRPATPSSTDKLCGPGRWQKLGIWYLRNGFIRKKKKKKHLAVDDHRSVKIVSHGINAQTICRKIYIHKKINLCPTYWFNTWSKLGDFLFCSMIILELCDIVT